ncbi:MAG: tetrahydromethanopterin S-methyltransferase subunit A [Dehalococcoidia bacterium]|nr:tetrahydromethanopterin S-methyltransferase subunit A [Dehalococcoidia bacterium]
MNKVRPHDSYPPEPGCYLVGNPYSPVALAVLLDGPYEVRPPTVKNVPPEIEALVRTGLEAGAALSGTLQTENLGIEKIICNVVANPNIRFLVLCGREVRQYKTGGSLKALFDKGVNEKRVIIDAPGRSAYLFNVGPDMVERFLKQVRLINLLDEMDPEAVKQAVTACLQEQPAAFQGYTVSDPGAFPEPAIVRSLTYHVKHPGEVEEWQIPQILEKVIAAERGMGEPTMESLGSRLARIAEELGEVARGLMKQ